ncbi:MAG: hypothetical protein A2288_00365 [Candidatus Moranbacteria bacterium RIFOXYA12_FULL_44_15]|nr:MAG: hypothetical protein A2288_00365 [Candidatus Moranbacteria bacterium RIFOXYA12_FULL_44_15]OGI35247.1 MAG: hypothetical protein A2259_03000 [Candidatus Moranbacteria bacterium RIFOXYA2_FULL_43_15]
MEGGRFENGQSKEKTAREKKFEEINRRIQETIVMIRKLLEKRGSKLAKYYEKFPSFCYSSEEAPLIRETFFRFKQALAECFTEDKREKLNFENSNLTHILGNGPYGTFALAERRSKQLEQPYDEVRRDYEIARKDLIQNKLIWDRFIYYIDFLSREDNKKILEIEANSPGGYLDNFVNYYKEDKAGNKDIPASSLIRLNHFNFFTRLNARDAESSSARIESIGDISQPILTEKEFERNFESLLDKDSLDKERVFQELFLSKKAIS